MMRNFLLLVALLTATVAGAQKVDQRLTRLAVETAQRRAQGIQTGAEAVKDRIAVDYDEAGSVRAVSVQAYLKKGAQCPTSRLEQMGITVRYVVDDVAVLSVPLDKVARLEDVDEIQFAKADELVHFMNDKAREVTKAGLLSVDANAATVGLAKAYTGKGVVLGVVDTGIDFNHKAFLDYQDNNRIKRVMIFHTDAGNNSKFTTPAEIKALTTDFNQMSHGTHTLATAAGTEQGNSLQGVAPEVEMVAVGLYNTMSESNVAQGIKYIAEYADEVKKPCVISISLGKETDLHDGSSLVAKAIKEVTKDGTAEGKAVLVSSSNSASMWGGIIQTLGAPGSDGYQLKAIMGCDNEIKNLDPVIGDMPEYGSIDFIAYAADGKDFTAEIKIVNTQTGAVTDDLTGKITDGDVLNPQPRTIELTKINNYPTASGATAVVYKATYRTKSVLKDPYERLAIFVKGNQGQTIKLINDDENARERNFFVPAALANQGYTEGVNNFSINTYVCDDAVISVGSTVSRTQWEYYQAPAGGVAYLQESKVTGKAPRIGDVSDFSSYCIADDNGKARPTVLAPGQMILSAYNAYDITSFEGDMPNVLLNSQICSFLVPEAQQIEGVGRKYWYGAMNGTSMSCPHAAGIVALWMEADKTLTVNRIKDVMRETCMTVTADQCPSKDIQQAGYGLIDAVAGLKNILASTGIDTVEAATPTDDNAPAYNMMGQRVSRNTRGLVIYRGKKYVNK